MIKRPAYNKEVIFEQELLYHSITNQVALYMQDNSISQHDVAEKIGLSEARISNILNGDANITLRTTASLAYAVGMRFEVELKPIEANQYQSSGVQQHAEVKANVAIVSYKYVDPAVWKKAS